MKIILKYASAALIFVGVAFTAPAQQPTTRSVQELTLAGAQQAIAAAEQEAERLHAPCAIAVVDHAGVLVAFVKMDDVREGSPDLAIGKARTSALLERPSAETEDNTNNGRTAFVTAGFMALRGGMPLIVRHNGASETVGAIGIASLNKDNDATIATVAAAAFTAASAQ